MRIASFNVENLFCRVRAMNADGWKAGKDTLAQYSRINAILAKPAYTAKDKRDILDALDKLGLTRSDESPMARLRQNHGRLVKRPKSGPIEVVVNGRNEWIGWVELKTEAVDETATAMTAKVIRDVDADVLAVVEAENRVALCHFNDQLLKPIAATYSGIMLIDGNDDRGIDVGLLAKSDFAIESVASHVDDVANGRHVFSRDCPEYTVRRNGGPEFLILVNHLKSKGFGSQAESNATRKAQARRVREIYEQRKAEGVKHIAVVGDFNDTPDSDPLKPLLGDGSDLKDISQHPRFKSDGRPGTYGNGTKSGKIDYILLSPKLFDRVTGGGVNRMGVWGGKNGTLFPHYPEIEAPCNAASDHAAIWADLQLA